MTYYRWKCRSILHFNARITDLLGILTRFGDFVQSIFLPSFFSSESFKTINSHILLAMQVSIGIVIEVAASN